MKISTRGRYALRIMLDIALQEGDAPVSLRDVSERQGISFKYMEQIGSLLIHGGFLSSVRGAQGGYKLIGQPADHTIGAILRVTENQISPVVCVSDDADPCPHCDSCLTRPLWEKLNDAMLDVLDNTTLQDLIDDGMKNGIIEIKTA